jgi:hypothetical protein
VSRSHSVIFQLAGQKLRQEIQEGIETVISNLREIFILDPIPSHMRSFSQLSNTLESDASNIAGAIAALPNDRKKEIEQTLVKYASQLPERDIRKVYAETVGIFKSDAMLDMLKTVGTQRRVDVLVTTHNPALLDAMGTEMVPFITVANRDINTGYSILTLLEDIDQLPKLLAQGPIGRLSSQGLIEKGLNSQ